MSLLAPQTASHRSASHTLRAATLAILALAHVGTHAAPPELPPPPTHYPHSEERGKSPDAIDQLTEQYNQAHKAWHNSLTPEQQAAYSASLRSSFGRPPSLPTPGRDYDWHTSAKQKGLTPAEIAQLDRDKLLLEDISLRQSFEAYTMPRGPVFITSDSALNAFQVLFEDSFRELELRRAFALRVRLENIVTEVREILADKHRNSFPVAELQPGWRHAQLVVGPALRLLGTLPEFFDADTRAEIEQQLGKIRAAATVELPPWLAPASRTLLAIDYRRCTPVGFYTDTESLQNYFRAVRWLQCIPFRADRADELTAIGLLAYATNQSYRDRTEAFFRTYATLLGRPDDPALPEAAYEFQNFLTLRRDSIDWKTNLIDKRRWLLRSSIARDEWKKLNDSLRLPPSAADKLGEIQFRVLSPYRLPDSIALAKLSEPDRLPSGLAVAALLGSDFARRQLANIAPEKLDAALTAAREDWHATKKGDRYVIPSLYDRYLDTLAALHLPAEPDAPAFMRNEAWAAKSCLTTLASWAQMRHTFTLQAKQTVHYLGMTETPPGFIEPCPEFFRRLADLVESVERALDEADVFLPSSGAEAERLRHAAADLEALGVVSATASSDMLEHFSADQLRRYSSAVSALDGDAPEMFATVANSEGSPADFQKAHRELIENFRQRADDLAAGKITPAPERSTSQERWDALKTLTRRLEALAHKQLRRQPWTTDEASFIRKYGERLAFVHGYFGNSWLTPRDDAPRWTTVAHDPNSDTQLAVAAGRPRLIHVLYPYKEGEVLSTGAVMSYYEYGASGAPLTDAEWRTKIDGPQAPLLPVWLSPYLAR